MSTTDYQPSLRYPPETTNNIYVKHKRTFWEVY